jgi:hypothetical protein
MQLSARKAVERKRFAESQNAESSASLRDSNPSSSASSSATSANSKSTLPTAPISKKQKMIEKFRNADNSSSQDLDLCIQNEVHTYLHV